MDEVDGMGSGDHGGLGELSKLIKTTKVPIICMANDKDSQKMRNFKNNCFVNNFPKIRVQNIKATVMKIMYVALRTLVRREATPYTRLNTRFKEGCKIDSQALEAVIEGANCDMRQILNNLQMWSRTSKSLTYDGVRKDVDSTVKDMKENPFAFASRFFSSRFHQESLDERIQVYFNDSSMAPNFVQEMYVQTSCAELSQVGLCWRLTAMISQVPIGSGTEPWQEQVPSCCSTAGAIVLRV